MIGQVVSHYRIVERLGAGGMGVVYKAEDTRLHRAVAVKFLPEAHFENQAARERFEREAQSASALNHPHICTIYDVGEHERRPFIVMECLEGQTLRSRIAADRLATSQILELGLHVADALDAAHAKGIVHRDIKPANIFVTNRGEAKVLDFGLATLDERESGSQTEAPTALPERELTSPGTAVGTVAYMSPEQALGKPLDARTDLFSLGVVLYEMAARLPPFRGDTSAAVFNEILNREPQPVVRANPELPDELDRLLRKCLEKDRELRYQSARELVADLKRLRRDTTSGATAARGSAAATAPPVRARPRWLRPVTGGAVVLVAAALAAWLVAGRRPEPAGPVSIKPFTSDGGQKAWPQLSPDAERVVYSWAPPGEVDLDVYVKGVGLGMRPLRLTEHPGDDISPVWSPDGRQIAFLRVVDERAAIYTEPSLGGQERKLMDVSGPTFAAVDLIPALSWSPDGKALLYAERPVGEERSHIVRLPLATLEKDVLTSPPTESVGDFYPTLSPDGNQLAFVRASVRSFGGRDIWVQPVAGGSARQLTSERYGWCYGPGFTPSGREIVFTGWADNSVRIARVSLKGGTPQLMPGLGNGAYSGSVRGQRMVYVQGGGYSAKTMRLGLSSADAKGRAPEPLFSRSVDEAEVTYSPDGRRLAFISSRTGVNNIWTSDVDGSHPVQLTDFRAHCGSPRWSPDGRRLVFDSIQSGSWDVYLVDVEGGAPRRLTQEASEEGTASWSRDGRFLYFRSDRGGSLQLWKMPAEGGPAVQLTHGGGYNGFESADGRYVYYTPQNEGGGIWRVPASGGEEVEVVKGPIFFQNFALGQRGIYYVQARRRAASGTYDILYLDLVSGKATTVFHKQGPGGLRILTVSADEKNLLYLEDPAAESELMLVDNFR
jgi:Tol biopolymer transport system component